jgi:hypothetical protein
MNMKKKILTLLVLLMTAVTGAWAQYPVVYDFEAAANAGENPPNKNGTAANGLAFYGWENPGRTDSKRQDYKGYEWAEGSVLPEVCHVWRRSDRINGNVANNGGLKCPSDKEMAIDGLEPASRLPSSTMQQVPMTAARSLCGPSATVLLMEAPVHPAPLPPSMALRPCRARPPSPPVM